MKRFQLLEPHTLDEAAELLVANPDAKLIAGGTALLILIKQGVFVPGTLINLHMSFGLTILALVTVYVRRSGTEELL